MSPAPHDHAIEVHLDQMLTSRGITLTELAHRVGITVVNLSVLKSGRARAIRFSTLAALCAALDCQPGDLLRYHPNPPDTAPRPGLQPGTTTRSGTDTR
jgi:putative transcriptional regulator